MWEEKQKNIFNQLCRDIIFYISRRYNKIRFDVCYNLLYGIFLKRKQKYSWMCQKNLEKQTRFYYDPWDPWLWCQTVFKVSSPYQRFLKGNHLDIRASWDGNKNKKKKQLFQGSDGDILEKQTKYYYDPWQSKLLKGISPGIYCLQRITSSIMIW